MANPDYYNLAQSYLNKKIEEQNKKEEYEKAIPICEEIKSNATTIKENLSASKDLLLSGGFIVEEGKSLDNGQLAVIVSSIDGYITSLEKIISKSKDELSLMPAKIQTYGALYDENMKNYRRALAAKEGAYKVKYNVWKK